MTDKRRALAALTRSDLLLLGRAFQLQVSPRMSLEELHRTLTNSGRGSLAQILPELPDASVAKIGQALGLPAGEARPALVTRILEATGEATPPLPAEILPVQTFTSVPVAVAAPLPAPPPSAPTVTAPARVPSGAELSLSIEVEPRKPRLA